MVPPLAGDGGQAGHGMQVGRTVARAGEAVADADIGALGPAVEGGEGLDFRCRKAGDARCPVRPAALQMGFQLRRAVGEFRQIVPVGVAVAEQDMHDGAGERPVGAGPHGEVHVRLFGRAGAVGVDHDQLRAAAAARPGDVGHHVDLGVHRVAAPHDDQVGILHLARIDAVFDADPGEPAGVGQRVAEGRVLARPAHGVAQPVDAVALHQPHGAGVEIGPDRLAAPFLGGRLQPVSDLVERLVPADRREGVDAVALRPDAAQRPGQARRMVDPLGIARDLGADHAGGIVVALRAVDPADGVRIEPLDIERAGARTVVRAGRGDDPRFHIKGRGVERHGAYLSASTVRMRQSTARRPAEQAGRGVR